MRVYEFAKLLNISNKDLIALLVKEGFDVKSHMAALSQEAIQFLNDQVARQESKKSSVSQQAPQKPEQPKEPVKTMSSPVMPKEISPRIESSSFQEPVKQSSKVEEIKKEAEGLSITSMSLGELAQKIDKPVSEIVIFLLKQGIVCAKNQLLSEQTIETIAKHFQIPYRFSAAQKKQDYVVAKTTGTHARMPIVVVLGHVDHGKTTLLDFIRKTKVAAKEKGGITQHLGAYEVSTPQGSLVLLDTPGHEAFSNIRGRGVNVADIAVLVVAADDSIMPQTVEAIKKAQQAEVSIIVAINKMDKVDPSRVETVKRDLARYELIPEEWGGSVICVPISAKLGTGIDHLLEMIMLQTEMMDLKTDLEKPATGFILESKMEKGRGPVATVICQQGILRIGDYFATDHMAGKVTSLMDSSGKSVKEAIPSVPVLVAGFPELAKAGDYFEIISAAKYKTMKTVRGAYVSPITAPVKNNAVQEDAYKIIIKTDTRSTEEALLETVAKVIEKAAQNVQIIYHGIGDITESDIAMATDTGAEILGLHIKAEAKAVALAQKNFVAIRLFDIIYKLLEDMELRLKKEEPVRYVTKKIGEAVVRKIFDIKNVGIIAGCYVKEGRFAREGHIVVWRGRKQVGEGTIRGLERDKKSVKEVHAGFEFAFLADGFNAWEIDDKIECFLKVPEAKV